VSCNSFKLSLNLNSSSRDKLFVSYSQDVKSTLELRNLHNGTLIQHFPLEASAIVSTEARRQDFEFYFKTSTFSNPGTTYFLNLSGAGEPYEFEVFEKTKVPFVDPTKFTTKQVFYTSKDGTRIPMFLMHRLVHGSQLNY
jgi:prolyl oligopeptidase